MTAQKSTNTGKNFRGWIFSGWPEYIPLIWFDSCRYKNTVINPYRAITRRKNTTSFNDIHVTMYSVKSLVRLPRSDISHFWWRIWVEEGVGWRDAAVSTNGIYRVFIKYCVFSFKCCDFSELCQFCCSAGVVWPAIVYTLWKRVETKRGQSSEYILKYKKNHNN